MGREDRDAMSKMSQWNQSPVYIHSLDADTCLKVPVHFCYSSPSASSGAMGGSPDGRDRFSLMTPLTRSLPSVGALGVSLGRQRNRPMHYHHPFFLGCSASFVCVCDAVGSIPRRSSGPPLRCASFSFSKASRAFLTMSCLSSSVRGASLLPVASWAGFFEENHPNSPDDLFSPAAAPAAVDCSLWPGAASSFLVIGFGALNILGSLKSPPAPPARAFASSTSEICSSVASPLMYASRAASRLSADILRWASMNSALRLRLYRSMSYAVYAVRRPATAVRGGKKQLALRQSVEMARAP